LNARPLYLLALEYARGVESNKVHRRPSFPSGRSLSKKRDIQQIEAIGREFQMDPVERREFGDYVEDCKRKGVPGTGPNGDYSYHELRQRANEFREGDE
jgi:hypothetical protein